MQDLHWNMELQLAIWLKIQRQSLQAATVNPRLPERKLYKPVAKVAPLRQSQHGYSLFTAPANIKEDFSLRCWMQQSLDRPCNLQWELKRAILLTSKTLLKAFFAWGFCQIEISRS